jgi:excisionase family DNA binding protein
MSRVFLTVADVAERWHCSQALVRKLVRAGDIPHVAVMARGFRFTQAAIEAYEQDVLKLGSVATQERDAA